MNVGTTGKKRKYVVWPLSDITELTILSQHFMENWKFNVATWTARNLQQTTIFILTDVWQKISQKSN